MGWLNWLFGRSKAGGGIAKIVELCSRDDLLSFQREEIRDDAVALLKQEGAEGIDALAEVIRELLKCRSKDICLALEVAERLEPTSALVEAVREVSSASGVCARPTRCRFTPELVGADEVGWTDQRRAHITSYAEKVLEALTKSS